VGAKGRPEREHRSAQHDGHPASDDAPKRRPPKSLQARAVGYLARREYARSELRDKLLATGAPADEVDPVLDDLAAQGYLSDERFAHALVRQKQGAYSQRSIAQTLKAKGVAGEVAAEALAGAEADDAATLVALWRRRFGRAPADDRERARQVRFLQSRGFPLSAILKLLRDPPTDE
jgi:regulatory protein